MARGGQRGRLGPNPARAPHPRLPVIQLTQVAGQELQDLLLPTCVAAFLLQSTDTMAKLVKAVFNGSDTYRNIGKFESINPHDATL